MTLMSWVRVPVIGILRSLNGFYLVRVGLQKMHGVSPRPW